MMSKLIEISENYLNKVEEYLPLIEKDILIYLSEINEARFEFINFKLEDEDNFIIQKRYPICDKNEIYSSPNITIDLIKFIILPPYSHSCKLENVRSLSNITKDYINSILTEYLKDYIQDPRSLLDLLQDCIIDPTEAKKFSEVINSNKIEDINILVTYRGEIVFMFNHGSFNVNLQRGVDSVKLANKIISMNFNIIEEDTVGVIVGRFQVAELTEGHKHLINEVVSKFSKTIIFIGVTKGNTIDARNPLPAKARITMLKELNLPKCVEFSFIEDEGDWSKWVPKLDETVKSIIGDKNIEPEKIFICGSRDSVVDKYKEFNGKFNTYYVSEIPGISGTKAREDLLNEEIDWSNVEIRKAVIKIISSLQ